MVLLTQIKTYPIAIIAKKAIKDPRIKPIKDPNMFDLETGSCS